MSGLGIRLYTDEDVYPDLARQLTAQGYDILSSRDAGNSNQALDDEWQLSFAAGEARAILVFNIAHFVRLDARWRTLGREHFGIVLSPQLALGELVRRVKFHLDSYTPEYQYNTVLHLATP